MNVKLEQQADLLFANINGWVQSVLERIGKRINKIGKMSVADVQALNNIADVKGDMKEITKELARVTGKNVRQIEKIYADTLKESTLRINRFMITGTRFLFLLRTISNFKQSLTLTQKQPLLKW